uniref:Large ribosomal subunit protein uL15/eL18 domain-containing protein n=1 Tax=Oreochromis aureus TaxID=47969 RepID=A0A668T1R9_OREAU
MNGHFKRFTPRRFLMSRTKRSRIAVIHLIHKTMLPSHANKITAVVGTVTDDGRDLGHHQDPLTLKAGRRQRFQISAVLAKKMSYTVYNACLEAKEKSSCVVSSEKRITSGYVA